MRKKDKKIYPYFGNNDVEEMYVALTGSRKGLESFMKKAKHVASRVNKSPRSAYVYKDEEALFEVFKVELAHELNVRKIRYFGELVQMIS